MLVRLKKKLKKKHALLIVSVATALAGVFAISVNKICKIMEILITSNISMILYILFIKIANTPAKATATLLIVFWAPAAPAAATVISIVIQPFEVLLFHKCS